MAFLSGLRETDTELYERLKTHRMGGYETAAPAGYAPALEMVRMLATRPDVE